MIVFGVQSGFISGSVHAILQVSVCIGYDLCHPDLFYSSVFLYVLLCTCIFYFCAASYGGIKND